MPARPTPQTSGSKPIAPLARRLAVLREIDGLKSVVPQSPLLDRSRRENSAEHSWHLAGHALLLRDLAARPISPERVIQMLLIHDIVEVDVGVTPMHAGAFPGEQAEREARAAERLPGILPGRRATRFPRSGGSSRPARPPTPRSRRRPTGRSH